MEGSVGLLLGNIMDLEKHFGGTSLPMSMTVAGVMREIIEPRLENLSWPYEDKVLIWLWPSFRRDVSEFHEKNGKSLIETFDTHQVEHIDRTMLAALLRKLERVHPDVAASYMGLGVTYYSKGDDERAIEYYKKSLGIEIKALGEDHPDVANTCMGLGLAYDSKGDYDHAIEYYEKALGIWLKVLGAEHPERLASSYMGLGLAYDSKGDFDHAIENYKKSLAIEIKVLGGDHPDVAHTYFGLGDAYDCKGDRRLARDLYQKAYDIYIKSSGPADRMTRLARRALDSL